VVGSDRGVATVWAAMAVAVLMAMAGFGVDLGAAVVARHRVEAAADLAALAAAAHAVDGQPVACAHGDRVAKAMAVWLSSCRVVGQEVFVELEVHATIPLVTGGDVRGRAHAGPVTSGPVAMKPGT
jgi:secretion/DNA translocation related TadE-like protein